MSTNGQDLEAQIIEEARQELEDATWSDLIAAQQAMQAHLKELEMYIEWATGKDYPAVRRLRDFVAEKRYVELREIAVREAIHDKVRGVGGHATRPLDYDPIPSNPFQRRIWAMLRVPVPSDVLTWVERAQAHLKGLEMPDPVSPEHARDDLKRRLFKMYPEENGSLVISLAIPLVQRAGHDIGLLPKSE